MLSTCCELTVVLGAAGSVRRDLTQHLQQQVLPPKVIKCEMTGQVVNAKSSEVRSVKTEGSPKFTTSLNNPAKRSTC